MRKFQIANFKWQIDEIFDFVNVDFWALPENG